MNDVDSRMLFQRVSKKKREWFSMVVFPWFSICLPPTSDPFLSRPRRGVVQITGSVTWRRRLFVSGFFWGGSRLVWWLYDFVFFDFWTSFGCELDFVGFGFGNGDFSVLVFMPSVKEFKGSIVGIMLWRMDNGRYLQESNALEYVHRGFTPVHSGLYLF